MSDKITVKDNLKKFTEKFCPFLYDIIKDKEFIWDKVSSKFDEKLKNANEKIVEEGGITIENSLPILLGKAEEGDDISIRFLKFIDFEIKYLYDSAPTKLKDKTIGLFRRLFLEFDKEEQLKPNPTYLNGLSEILTVNKLIRSGKYKLEAIEEKFSNNKRADFLLVNVETKAKSYIEIYNIHIDSDKVVNFEGFNKFINDRINQKYLDKTQGLDSNINSQFYLVPIVWANKDVNEYIKEYTEKFNLQDIQVLKPCSLLQYDNDGTKSFYFGLNE